MLAPLTCGVVLLISGGTKAGKRAATRDAFIAMGVPKFLRSEALVTALPYVEVADVGEATERARDLGATVLLEPREGPAGWRGVVAAPAAGELAFWQPKRPRHSEQ